MATKNKAMQAAQPKNPITSAADKARAALMPSINGAIVIEAYQGNIMGKDADIGTMIDELRDTFKAVNGGDLQTMEKMLISQATALQTMFTHLAKRAADQSQLKHYEAFLGMSLKAQAQSRATISALVDLKYPRQATFVKQANIAHGPQQVNNGIATPTHAANSETQQNQLLEDSHGGTHLDTGTTAAAARSNPAMETVEQVYRAAKPRG